MASIYRDVHPGGLSGYGLADLPGILWDIFWAVFWKLWDAAPSPIILIILLLGFGYWLGPPWKRMEPEMQYFLAFAGQPLRWPYLLNTKSYYAGFNGALLPGGSLLRYFCGFGAYRFIWGWPIIYLKKDNPDGSMPQKPLDIKELGLDITVPEAELKEPETDLADSEEGAGINARLIIGTATWRVRNPFEVLYGRVAVNWQTLFVKEVIGAIRCVALGLTPKEVETPGILRDEIRAALVLSDHPGIIRRIKRIKRVITRKQRAAEYIANRLGLEVLRFTLTDVQRSAEQQATSKLIREGRAKVVLNKKNYDNQLQFGDGVAGLYVKPGGPEAVEVLRLLNFGSGGGKADIEAMVSTSKRKENK